MNIIKNKMKLLNKTSIINKNKTITTINQQTKNIVLSFLEIFILKHTHTHTLSYNFYTTF